MYAHQVIDSLRTYEELEPNTTTYRIIMQEINDSQKFHAGSAGEMLGFMSTTLGDGLFSSHLSRPPYPQLWVDFLDERIRVDGFVHKCGVLVTDMGQGAWKISEAKFSHSLIGFVHNRGLGQWMMAPIIVGFTPGNDHAVAFGLGGGFELPSEDKPKSKMIVSQLASVAYAAIMFLNCKGTRSESVEAPHRLNRARRKNGRMPLFSYKKLVVPPVKGARERKERVAAGESVRVHLCRGHFKEYTESSPLFGKLTGLFWCPPHVRGDKEKGIVHKDYVLKTA